MTRVATAFMVLAAVACRPEEQPVAPAEAEAAAGAAKGALMVWPDEAFRYEAPVPGPTPQVVVPTPQVFELEGGITVYLVPRKTIPTISLSLVFPTGSVIDPKGKAGLGSACMDLVEQGTQRLDKSAFEAAKADLASGVSAWADSEASGVAMSCVHRSFADTADLMLEMLEKPGLRARDLERLRSRRKSNLAQNKAAPASLGQRLWRSVIWGPQHPYGALTTGAQYDTLTVDDCRKWLGNLGTVGAQMFVAGSTDEAEIRSVFEPRLAAWGKDAKGRARKNATIAIPPAATRKGTIFFSDVPGAAQSQIFVGHSGPPRVTADHEATMIMAAVLGGSFSSRINMNIREDKGYAYGARARFSYRKFGGTFAASSSVRSDATAAALTEIVKEIRAMRASGVLPEEIERERQGTLLGLPARFSTAGRVRNTVSSLLFFGLPLDYYGDYQKRIEALDEGDLQTAAQQHLRDRDYSILVVGDGATVRQSLMDLAASGTFGDDGFVELDGDGTPIRAPGLGKPPPPT